MIMKKDNALPKSNINIKLKDIYDSAIEGKQIKRLKEMKKKTKKSKFDIIPLTEDQLNEDFITRWIDSFFEKVKARRADDIIKDAKKKDPKLGAALEKIEQSSMDAMELLRQYAKISTT